MKKLYYLIVIVLISSLVLTGCSLLSNIGQAPATEQSGITYLTKGVPLSVDLVGLWRFDGNAEDSSGNDNHGTVCGEESYIDSLMGQALIFDGIDDYVDCGAAVDDSITTGITLEAWIKPAFKQNGGIVSSDITDSSKKGYDFFLWASGTYGRLYIDFGNGSSRGRTWWDIPSLDWYDQWHHVAATWDGNVIKLYADESKVAEVVYTGDYSNPEKNTLIGAINYLDPAHYYFNRLIDEVRIWNSALSLEQLGSVIYDFGGILPPIKEDGSRAFKLGSTVPVKFQLWDADGEIVTNAEACIFVEKIDSGTIGEIEAVSTAASTTGNLFRYDPDSEQYIFNLSTKLPLNEVNWSTGTWQIRIKLDDGTSKFVNIVLK